MWGFLPVILPATLRVSPAPPPPGLVWTVRPAGSSSADLYRVGADGGIARDRLPYRLNALGCTGGFLYGLAAPFPDGPHVVRIPARGSGSIDLGPVGGHSVANAYAATATTAADGTVSLVVDAGGVARTVRVAPGPPTVTDSTPLPAAPYLGDWDGEPGGGLVTLAVRHGGALVVRVAADRLTVAETPTTIRAGAFGGVARGPDGTLWGLENATGRLWRVPAEGEPDARPVADGPLSESDAAYCAAPHVPAVPVPRVRILAVTPTPTQPAPSHRVSPPPASPSPSPSRPKATPTPGATPVTSAPPHHRHRHREFVDSGGTARGGPAGPESIPIVGAAGAIIAFLATRAARKRR